jgi:hypothetical protein
MLIYKLAKPFKINTDEEKKNKWKFRKQNFYKSYEQILKIKKIKSWHKLYKCEAVSEFKKKEWQKRVGAIA